MARGEVIQVRVSAEEKADIARLAAAAGVSPSQFIRSRALLGALGEASGVPVGAREAVVDRAAPASPRASGPKSVVREGAPIGELPKVARRHWADD